MSFDECVGVVFIHRHGARGVVGSTLRKLLSVGAHAGGNAASGWAVDELEEMTPVGLEQMRELGRWLALRYLPGLGCGSASRFVQAPPKWRSSTTKRVVDSGSALMTALAEALPSVAVPSAPAPYRSDAEVDFVFRNWHTDGGYLSAIRELRESAGMAAAAVKVRSELDALYGALLGAAPSLEEGALHDSTGDAALGRRLFQCTYLLELLSCEMYWPATAAALRNGLVARPSDVEEAALMPPAAGRGAGATVGVAGPPTSCIGGGGHDATSSSTPPGRLKANLLRRLSPQREQWLRSTARWVWEQRFLASTLTRPFGGVLGGAIVAEALVDLGAAAAVDRVVPGVPTLSVYSAHDYTLLSILAALRVAHHPAACIEFGAFIAFELWRPIGEKGTTGASVTIRMCADPFSSAREGLPTALSTAGMHTVCEGVAFSALTNMAQKWPTWKPEGEIAAPGPLAPSESPFEQE